MTWEKQIQGGISAIQRADYAAAEQSLKNALQFAKENFSRSDDRLALTLSFLGHFYFNHKDFARAERLLESSLRLHSQSSRFTDPCYMMDLCAMSEIRDSQQKRVEACRMVRDHLAVWRNAEAVDWIIWDSAIEMFAALLGASLDQLAERERLEYEGGAADEEPMCESTTTSSHAVRENEVDESTQESLEESAEHCAEQSVERCIDEPAISEHADPTLTQETLAAAAGEPKENSSQSGPPQNAEAGTVSGGTSGGASGGALSGISSGAPASRPPSVSGSHSMADVWKQQLNSGVESLQVDDDEKERWVSAYLNIESAVRLAYRLYKPGEQNLTLTLSAFAEASAKLKMFEQAEMLYQEAMQLTKRSEDGSGPGDFYALHLQLAVLYCDFEQFKQAKTLLEEWGSEQEALQSPLVRDLAARLESARERIKVYDCVQDFVVQAGQSEEKQDFEKAAKLANNALLQLKQGFPPNHPEQARVLRYRARLLRSLGNMEQADELSQRAERIERANDQAFAEFTKLTEDLPKAELPTTAAI